MNNSKLIGIILLGLILVGCGKTALDSSSISNRHVTLPTASEVFELRSKCAALGDKMMSENVIDPALAQEVNSHYNPSTNRCYVELDVHNADLSAPKYKLSKFLYDGQTSELLATLTTIGTERQAGMVFDPMHKSTNSANAGFDDADDYIASRMSDDRQQ